MIDLLKTIQCQLADCGLKYIDEDWGQLDLYPTDYPVQFPCVLFDIKNATFENMGNNNAMNPKNRQIGQFRLELCIADIKLTNTSAKATISQKNKAWDIHCLIQKVHEKLHGFSPKENCSRAIRKSIERIRRDDGVQEYRLVYEFRAVNV